jgi:nucleoside-triphosphatase THEP1
MIALVTGAVGCGKTTTCRRALELLQRGGMKAGGILSPARLDACGAKTGIDVINVATGERRRLAEYVTSGGRTIGSYTFDERTLSWASGCIRAAVSDGCALLVVDEIGPLELVHHAGLVAALDLLADPKTVPHALVIVRRAYLERLQRRLNRRDLCCFWVDEDHRESLPHEIATALKAGMQEAEAMVRPLTRAS